MAEISNKDLGGPRWDGMAWPSYNSALMKKKPSDSPTVLQHSQTILLLKMHCLKFTVKSY